MSGIGIKTYTDLSLDKREILRYAGCRESSPEVETLLQACLEEAQSVLGCRVCFRRFPIGWDGEELDLGFTRSSSADLKKNLKGCGELVLLGATVGLGLDRKIMRYSRVAPAKALLFQAIGAECIETLCDRFCEELAQQEEAKGRFLRPRFSPGYGDLPLDLQKDIFRVMDCPGKIGLTLNDSLLMSPTKSVTALIGIGGERAECAAEKCAACKNYDCAYRSE